MTYILLSKYYNVSLNLYLQPRYTRMKPRLVLTIVCFIFIKAHIKGISSLIMLSEGTLISGGEKDRKIAAWDSLQNYKRITETKVQYITIFLIL